MCLHTRDEATLLLQAFSSCALYTRNATCIASVMAFYYAKRNTDSWKSYVAFHNAHKHQHGRTTYGPQVLNPTYRLRYLRNRWPCNLTNPIIHTMHHICQRFKRTDSYIRCAFTHEVKQPYCCEPLALVS